MKWDAVKCEQKKKWINISLHTHMHKHRYEGPKLENSQKIDAFIYYKCFFL